MKHFLISFMLYALFVPAMSQNNEKISSLLQIYDIETQKTEIIFEADYHLEAPNWTMDGAHLIFNSNGKLFQINIDGSDLTKINTDFANRCNNDHVLSPDGSKIAISHQTMGDDLSRIYILPIHGGVPQLVTPKGPSYLHGWSPDGQELSYCAQRNGNYDVYTINIKGGKEERLTFDPGLDDGPEYSPDGKFIYFNSVRTGQMKVFRMMTNGKEQKQLTFGKDYNDWFPHISPDGQWIVFLSYDANVEGHPANKHVRLRLMNTKDYAPETIVKLYGGQGTINVNSWSPNSKRFAFVSYEK